MKALVQYAEEQGFVEQLWGCHTHLSEVADINSRQVDIAQGHTNYQVSMGSEELIGVINVNKAADAIHPTKGKAVATYSLRYILLNYMRMKDNFAFIAEVH